jgi:hypothetical protein
LEFDRFLIEYAARNRHWKLNQVAMAWLSSKPGRKPISVSADAAVLRQFYRYLRRSSESARRVYTHKADGRQRPNALNLQSRARQ